MKKLNVAIIGQGRSGRDIHGVYFKSEKNTQFNVAYVVDRDEKRRQRALTEYPDCEVFASHTELFGKEDIDLVLNSTISNEHFEITKDLLEHGFNVLVEKPFARTRYECDTLIKLAKDKGVKLAVFQQTFFAPYYEGLLEVIKSGKLGEIKQVDITFSNLARRWDWQTAQVTLGGNIYNTGPHPIGIALGVLDFDENTQVAFSKLDHVLSSGDSDDYSKIILTAPGRPVVDLEINSTDAYPVNHVKLIGTRGTYWSDVNSYKMKYIVDGENPERELVLSSYENEEGYPAYCYEELITHEESGEYVGSAFDVGTQRFYEMMYDAIVNDAQMSVKPEHASMIIGVIEEVHAANPLPVKF